MDDYNKDDYIININNKAKIKYKNNTYTINFIKNFTEDIIIIARKNTKRREEPYRKPYKYIKKLSGDQIFERDVE